MDAAHATGFHDSTHRRSPVARRILHCRPGQASKASADPGRAIGAWWEWRR